MMGQTYRVGAKKLSVDFYTKSNWKDYIPIVNWFSGLWTSTEYDADFDVVSYEFKSYENSAYNIIQNDKIDPLYGLVNVSLAQDVKSEEIFWSTRTIMESLAALGGQTVAIFGLVGFSVMHYQQFAYDRSALKQLYYETKYDEGFDTDYKEDMR